MKLPAFSLQANDGKTYSEKDFASGIFVLYVYPRDMTPGCTLESQNFRDQLPQFEAANAQVFGLSKDSVASHQKFCEKESLPFLLLADPEKSLLEALGVWKEKNMYGKTVMGVERSTFVIHNGAIVKEWRGVKVPGHVQAVLEFVQSLA